MKTILITGATGYIGSMLVKKLSEKYNVLGVSRKNESCNFYSWENLPKINIDVVIHLAGKAHDLDSKNYKDYYNANVLTTKLLIDFCNTKNVDQFIFLSTSKVYLNEFKQIKENSPKEAKNPYQETKIIAENLIVSNLDSTNYYILQPPIVISNKEKGNIGLLKKIFSILPLWPLGGFKNSKSVISYKNLEFFIEQLITKKPKSNTFIVCDDKTVSTTDLIKLKFPDVRVINTGKWIWNFTAFVCSFFRIKFFNKRVLQKLVKSETYSNQKIKKELNLYKTRYDVSQAG